MPCACSAPAALAMLYFEMGNVGRHAGNLRPQPGDQRTGPQFANHRSIRIKKPRGQSGSSSRACEGCEGIPEDETPPASLGLVTCCRQNCGDLQQTVDNEKNRSPLQWLEREPKPPPAGSPRKTRHPAGRPNADAVPHRYQRAASHRPSRRYNRRPRTGIVEYPRRSRT
jgi:hypothetical protein